VAKTYDIRRNISGTVEATLDTTGLATEATLQGVRDQTDLFTFTGDDLNVNASISADGLASEVTLSDILLFQKRTENILSELLKEQKLTNKLLRKIYNPE
jgi:hypothetical protein